MSSFSNQEFIVCIGATEDGIGAVYKEVKEMGFDTIGIVVSLLALSYAGQFSQYVNRIYIINDHQWGGFVDNDDQLSQTTKTFLGISDIFVGLGGGINTMITLSEAKKMGVKVRYYPFEMNHKKAKLKFSGDFSDYLGPAYFLNKE